MEDAARQGCPGPNPRGPLSYLASRRGGDIKPTKIRNSLVLADTTCTKAPNQDTADTITRLDLLFARFWSMLSEQIHSSAHQVLTSSSNRRPSPSTMRMRATAIPARARIKLRKKASKHAWAQRLYTRDYAQQKAINHSLHYLKA
ncbi:Hypothetical predicted protein [Pelobates cultripes]|uniref:Uncharacterized protein n=1 Tax=Pelobates cultripes TaxID=61616 RepID=A0AAD1RS99_PELCU|nr:Hypothetical predicted protein [Pelobates cultripes]